MASDNVDTTLHDKMCSKKRKYAEIDMDISNVVFEYQERL